MEGSDKNGVLPKRKQYSVTPRAQMSMDFVIGGRMVLEGDRVCEVEVRPKEGAREVGTLEEEGNEDGSTVCSNMTSGAKKEGVPARLVNSESSRRMGSHGSSIESLRPAPASRCAYEKWDTPKSPILTCWRSSVHNRFAGLMSR